MTINKAKRIIDDELKVLSLVFTRLSARTIGFQDLSRGDCVFVKIHGWEPNPLAENIRLKARENGFRVEFEHYLN